MASRSLSSCNLSVYRRLFCLLLLSKNEPKSPASFWQAEIASTLMSLKNERVDAFLVASSFHRIGLELHEQCIQLGNAIQQRAREFSGGQDHDVAFGLIADSMPEFATECCCTKEQIKKPAAFCPTDDIVDMDALSLNIFKCPKFKFESSEFSIAGATDETVSVALPDPVSTDSLLPCTPPTQPIPAPITPPPLARRGRPVPLIVKPQPTAVITKPSPPTLAEFWSQSGSPAHLTFAKLCDRILAFTNDLAAQEVLFHRCLKFTSGGEKSSAWTVSRVRLEAPKGSSAFPVVGAVHNHSVLIVSPPAHRKDEAEKFVIDFRFKELFEVARPTTRLQLLMDTLPNAFVGPECALIRNVNVLSSEVARSFEDQGMHLPPWRHTEWVRRWFSSVIQFGIKSSLLRKGSAKRANWNAFVGGGCEAVASPQGNMVAPSPLEEDNNSITDDVNDRLQTMQNMPGSPIVCLDQCLRSVPFEENGNEAKLVCEFQQRHAPLITELAQQQQKQGISSSGRRVSAVGGRLRYLSPVSFEKCGQVAERTLATSGVARQLLDCI